MVQWLRIYLPMQGTEVQALVREDPTCRRATKPGITTDPVLYSQRATTTEACAPRAPQQRKATKMRSPRTARKSSPRWQQVERKPAHSNEDPTQPKIDK